MTRPLSGGIVGDGGGGVPSGLAGGINVEGSYPDALRVVSLGQPPNDTVVIWDQDSLGAPVPGGVRVAAVSGPGSYAGADGEYPATQVATSGAGTLAEFVVVLAGGAVTAVACVSVPGKGYAVSDTITLLVVGPIETTAAVLDVSIVANVIAVNGQFLWCGHLTLDDGVAVHATNGGITTFDSTAGLEQGGLIGNVPGPMFSGTATVEKALFKNVHASGSNLHIFNTVSLAATHLKYLTMSGTAAGEVGPVISGWEQQSVVFDMCDVGMVYKRKSTLARIYGSFSIRVGPGFVAHSFKSTATIDTLVHLSQNTFPTSDATQVGFEFEEGFTVPDGEIVVGDNSIAGIGGKVNLGKLVNDGPGFLDPFDSLKFVVEGNNTLQNWGASGESDVANTALPIVWSPGVANIDVFEVLPVDNGAGSKLALSTATARRFALVLGLLDAATINAGGTYVGPDGNYEATQQSTSGTGSGAVLTVTVTGGAVVAVVSVDDAGSGYTVGNTITLDIAGLAETVAAVVDVAAVTWYLEYLGSKDNVVFGLPWTIQAVSVNPARAVAVKYTIDPGGLGVWGDIDGKQSTRLQKDFTNRVGSMSKESTTKLNPGDRLRLEVSSDALDDILFQQIRAAPEARS